MNIDDLVARLPEQAERMRAARLEIGDGIPWYPYDSLANIVHLDHLLSGGYRDLDSLAKGGAVADIGAADGDIAFALEDVGGWTVDIVDTAATNMNGLRGARALCGHLGSRVGIFDVDLDRQFALPRDSYGLVLLLGILYHLQNPYYVLRELAARSSYCLLSTKVARFAGPARTPIGDLPVGYLAGPTEVNNDSTNYWIFSPAGLERLAQRAGWRILDQMNVGNTANSDPADMANDERMVMLLESAAP
jgi:tRNA (mo5U34)-methyltransferase